MAEGYNVGRDESAWQDLDEFLCEYVDGSMDPVVRQAFEEYVMQNPDLAEHVECLCQARRLLSRAHCPCLLRVDFLERLRQRMSVEAVPHHQPVMPGMYAGLAHLTAFTSALLVMTMVVMMVGAFLVDPDADDRVADRVATIAPDRAPAAGAHFSALFVAPDSRSLELVSASRITPIAPRRLPIVPLWADADWNAARPQAVAAAW